MVRTRNNSTTTPITCADYISINVHNRALSRSIPSQCRSMNFTQSISLTIKVSISIMKTRIVVVEERFICTLNPIRG